MEKLQLTTTASEDILESLGLTEERATEIQNAVGDKLEKYQEADEADFPGLTGVCAEVSKELELNPNEIFFMGLDMGVNMSRSATDPMEMLIQMLQESGVNPEYCDCDDDCDCSNEQ
jgi:hypothetical protein